MVTGYILEYSLAGSDVWTAAVEDWSYLSYEVQGLRPGARYLFRVKAINVHGPSRPSFESDVVTLEEYGKPTSSHLPNLDCNLYLKANF